MPIGFLPRMGLAKDSATFGLTLVVQTSRPRGPPCLWRHPAWKRGGSQVGTRQEPGCDALHAAVREMPAETLLDSSEETSEETQFNCLRPIMATPFPHTMVHQAGDLSAPARQADGCGEVM